MILVTGHLRLSPEDFDRIRDVATRTMEETRKEKGCILYAFGEDLIEPGVLRIVERWEDWASLEAHGKAPHMDAWRAGLAEVTIIEKDVVAHEAGEERVL